MAEPCAQRTLVKSPPELWAEVSDAAALARHLGEFGEISITRLEPETTVVWEGDRVSGTVRLEPAGWGTKVTLTAQVEEAPPPAASPPAARAPRRRAPGRPPRARARASARPGTRSRARPRPRPRPRRPHAPAQAQTRAAPRRRRGAADRGHR